MRRTRTKKTSAHMAKTLHAVRRRLHRHHHQHPPPQAGRAIHDQQVQHIAAAVRRFYERKEPFRVFHGSTNSTRPRIPKHTNVVDISKLRHVLHVDPAAKVALVEPNVPMDRLVEATLPYGLVPPVVMEFPGITVGGGYAGTSGESSSFKYGFFDRNITSVEMVLGDGSVVTCSDNQRPDLFRGAAGAVGSLGVATLLELQLIPAKQYVETTYHPFSTVAEAIEKIKQTTADPDMDYIDGIIYSKTQSVVITGRLTDDIPAGVKVQTFSRPGDPWFYLHVREKISSHAGGPIQEAIPLPEYLFRYDRGGFWVGQSCFEYFSCPFNRVTRWLFDDFMHTRMLYEALHASGQSTQFVVQDLALPYSTVEEFIQYTDDIFGIYPLWLCPLQPSLGPTFHPHQLLDQNQHDAAAAAAAAEDKPPQPLLNVGLWGQGPLNHNAFVYLNRHLESTLQELGGMKWGYAHHYYPESEFWPMYDRAWYEGLREKYHATSLPSVYDKVRVKSASATSSPSHTSAAAKIKHRILDHWPMSGLYGLLMAVRSGAIRQARRSTWKIMKWPTQTGIN